MPAVFLKFDGRGTKIYQHSTEKNTKGILKRIIGRICHDCRRKRMRIYKGHEHRDVSKNLQTVIAVTSERTAEERFKRLGFEVQRTQNTGPDLICKIADLTWLVEVKRAFQYYKVGRKGSWRTRVVHPLRTKDDLIAIVLPNNYVYIDSMQNHLSLCDKNGNRAVTSIVKEFGLSPLPQT